MKKLHLPILTLILSLTNTSMLLADVTHSGDSRHFIRVLSEKGREDDFVQFLFCNRDSGYCKPVGKKRKYSVDELREKHEFLLDATKGSGFLAVLTVGLAIGWTNSLWHQADTLKDEVIFGENVELDPKWFKSIYEFKDYLVKALATNPTKQERDWN